MPKYEICVKVWDEYVIEIEASTEEEAQAIGVLLCDTEGNNSDGGRDIVYCFEMKEEDDEEEE